MAASFKPYVYDFGEGTALIPFHGFPGSHKQSQFLRPWARKFNLRVLAPDRPGYGKSEPQPKSDLKKFIQGLEKVLDEKKIEKFYLLGLSGGNPSAVTAAGYFGDRVLGLASVCGLAPFGDAPEAFPEGQRKWLSVVKRTPEFLLRPMIDKMIQGFDPMKRIDDLISKLPEGDQQALNNSGGRAIMIESLQEAMHHGSAGAVFDLKSFVSPWPVDLDKIRVPYNIWHGEADRVVLPACARQLHASVPHSRLHLLPHEGHYSLPIRRAEEILTELLASGKN
jgi:pimeloyl-ACP methyl ester carboxylesterase